jgi:tRNA(fMet)-specific endonuclease VapC
MRYLLDTNILSDLIRNPQGRVAEQIRKLGEAEVCTSIVVAGELRYGAAKRGALGLSSRLEAVLGVLEARSGPSLSAQVLPSAATIC